jgi:hypothetical protein
MTKKTVIKNDGFPGFVIGDIVLDGIYRNRKRCGVYKITYGDKFYIGSSVHVLKRAKEHRSAINSHFRWPSNNSRVSASVLDHIRANRDIKTMFVEMLEDCSESELHLVEKSWLKKSSCNSKCLNAVFNPTIAPYTKKKIEFKPVVITEKLNIDTLKEFELWAKFLAELKKLKSARE